MPYIQYKSDKGLHKRTKELIQTADGILSDYATRGYDLTLRQLFYQFVSKNLIANTEKEYNALGSAVNEGRLRGMLNWDHVVDRTRNIRSVPHWVDPANIVRDAASSFRVDKWKRQPAYIEVWIEKDALIGVISRVCRELDVPYFSCRGYTSQSEMWRAAERIAEAMDNDHRKKENGIIIHLGDHDPSGIDMTRDIQDRLNMFLSGGEFDMRRDMDWITVNRVALTIDQINELNPPPNPAKFTDSRAKDYIAKYGASSWELDALSPEYMNDLIRDTILAYRDEDLWDEDVAIEIEYRAELSKASQNWSDITDFLEDK